MLQRPALGPVTGAPGGVLPVHSNRFSPGSAVFRPSVPAREAFQPVDFPLWRQIHYFGHPASSPVLFLFRTLYPVGEGTSTQKEKQKEKEKTNIMLTEKLRDAEQKAGNYDTLEKENASLKQKVSDLQFKIKDYEKNELLHIKEIEQLKKEAHKNSVTIEKLNTEKYKEHETIQAQLSEKTKLLSEQEKELNVLHIQLAEQSKESELIKERAVIEKEREMLSKIEELRNALDEAKEEKYNLRLQLTKLQK